MKKILSTVIAVCGALNLFAAYQYVQTGSLSPDDGGYPQGVFRIDSAQYWNVIFLGQPGFNYPAGVSEFGFYNTADGQLVNAVNNSVLGNFKPGDNIGLWVRDGAGRLLTSSEIGRGQATGLEDWGDGFIRFVYPNLMEGGSGGVYDMYISATDGASPDISASVPSGQPLPGVVATLLFGGSILAVGHHRKMKKTR